MKTLKAKFIILLVISTTVVVVVVCLWIPYDQSTTVGVDASLNGLSIDQVIQRSGTPEYDVRFVLSDSAMLEYRNGLLKIYPRDRLVNKTILIREMGWRARHRTSVVWFDSTAETWISIDNLSWGDRIQF